VGHAKRSSSSSSTLLRSLSCWQPLESAATAPGSEVASSDSRSPGPSCSNGEKSFPAARLASSGCRAAGDAASDKTFEAAGSARAVSEEAAPAHSRLRLGRCGGLAAAAGVFLLSLVFTPCLSYSEWYIDELFAAVRNADARGETPLLELLQNDFWGNKLWNNWTHKSYRPLVVLSYACQYWFNQGEIKPQPLRAFNVALHSTNALLLFWWLRRLKASRRWAFLAAGLFAVHPVHTENVIYLVGRADAMATFCWLLALLSWPLDSSRNRGCISRVLRLCLAALLAVIAGLCKESGFCVLLQLAVSELLGFKPLRGALPLLSIFGLVFGARNWFTEGTAAGFSFVDTPVQYHEDIMVRFFTYLYFHSKYAQLMVFPWTLSWDYSHDALPVLAATWRDVRVLGILMTYLGVTAVASWGFSRRKRSVLLGLSNVLIPFVPASNAFFIVGTTIGERLLYPCNVGAAVVLASIGTCSAAGRKGGSSRLFACGLLLLGVFTYRCSLRVYQWSDREQLFGPDAVSYPQSTKTRHQYGTVLHKVGRFAEALIEFEASSEIFGGNGLTDYCMAQILLETGRADEARQKFEKIFKGHGLGFGAFNIYALYVDYGFTLMMLQRFEEAVHQLQLGLARNEDVPHGLNALGYSLISLRRPEEAQTAFERGLHYEPDNPYLRNNLGVTLMLAGNLDVGAEMVVRAAQMEPRVPAFTHNAILIRKLADTGSWPEEQLVLELFFNRAN
ncbi:unnamed protein product, partial [Polarella glacialis]